MKEVKQGWFLILIIVLLALCVFSLSRYAPLLKAKQELEGQNREAKVQLQKLRSDLDTLTSRLEEQKAVSQEMLAENSELKTNIAKLQSDLNITNEQLELLTSSLLASNRENASLKEDKRVLAERLDGLLEENKTILAKISSIEELKKMINQIKKQVFNNKVLLLKKIDEQKMAEGNQGFVVKDGEATDQPKVYIEVSPAS